MINFDFSKVSDPKFFKENTLPAHSDHIWYSMDEANRISARLVGSDLYFDSYNSDSHFFSSLNGIWKFAYATNINLMPEGFVLPEFDCRAWSDIHVPAHMQLEGYDTPHYTNISYPWDGHENVERGDIPKGFNPVGAYVKYFSVPERFGNERIFISFKGVESAFILYLNGKYVGYSEDSFTPSDFDLTPFIIPGENKLALLVIKWSSGSWLEDQDFFRFSGIFRDVVLYSKPAVHIDDLEIKSYLNDSLTEADIRIKLNATAAGSVKIALYDGSAELCTSTIAINQGENLTNIILPAPKLWSAEAPELYGLLIVVSGKDGTTSEIIPQQIGIRRFELKDGIMQLNGKRIVFKGVNRHEFSSVNGRAISFVETRQDLINMKRNNINAIRTCHYPDNSFLYALADNLGLYIIDETNLETHGTWAWPLTTGGQVDPAAVIPGDNPVWEGAVLDRVNNIYKRDRNHASILLWSCGNESFGGLNIFKMSEKFRALDDTRLVHYEGIFNDRRYPDTSDVESQMYTSVVGIQKHLAENPDKPFICCEYSHAMGNSCGGLHKYTRLTDTEARYQGGFIWDYIDQSLTVRNRYGKEFEAYGGDFGDRPSDYNFSGDGICYGGPGRLSSPKMAEVKYDYQNIEILINDFEKFTVINKNLFVNTESFNCSISILQNGTETCRVNGIRLNVKPLSKTTFDLPELIKSFVKKTDKGCTTSRCTVVHESADDLEFTVRVSFTLAVETNYAPAGHELAYGDYTSHVTDTYFKSYKKPLPPFNVIVGTNNIGIRGYDYEILLNQNGLASYKKAGVEMIKVAPAPAFWRTPTDNDRGSKAQMRYAQWKLADLYGQITNFGLNQVPGKFSVTFDYTLPTVPASAAKVTYTIDFDGSIEVRLDYEPVEGLTDMPVFGMNFTLDADYNFIKWYGFGPGESYCDRAHGNKLGVYTAKCDESLSAYLRPQECANKLGVRYATITDRKGRGVKFTACSDVEGSGRYYDKRLSSALSDTFELCALPYNAHQLEAALHACELPAPQYTFVRVALGQLGIAGDNSWGAATHDEYRLDVSKPLSFRFKFECI